MFAVFAFGFAIGGLSTCLFIAIAPQRFNAMVATLAHCWRHARWYEKLGLLLLVAPIPGPVDEIIGLLVVRRITQRTVWHRQQLAEDTCSQHGVFCCDQCFNMQVVATVPA